jgi:hypothetical protein
MEGAFFSKKRNSLKYYKQANRAKEEGTDHAMRI